MLNVNIFSQVRHIGLDLDVEVDENSNLHDVLQKFMEKNAEKLKKAPITRGLVDLRFESNATLEQLKGGIERAKRVRKEPPGNSGFVTINNIAKKAQGISISDLSPEDRELMKGAIERAKNEKRPPPPLCLTYFPTSATDRSFATSECLIPVECDIWTGTKNCILDTGADVRTFNNFKLTLDR